MITFWSYSLDFPHLSGILNLVRQVKVVVFGHFIFRMHEGMAYKLTCWCILTALELITFLSWSVEFLHFGQVCSLVPCQSDWSLGAKGCQSYQIGRSTWSSLFCDFWRYQKSKFLHMKTFRFSRRGFPTPVQSDIWSFNYVCIATFVRVEVLRAKV